MKSPAAFISNLGADLRYSLRLIKENPLLSLSVIGVLAIAIGANTAILSAVQSLVFRQIPWPHAERVLIVWEQNRALGVEREGVSGSTYLDWREKSRSFEELALIEVGTGTLTGAGEPRQLPGLRVSANFLTMIGARPLLGRIFDAKDGATAAFQPVVLLTHAAWQRQFGGDPAVIGRTVMVDLQPFSVIGVLDQTFWAPVECDAVVVWPDAVLRRNRRTERSFTVIGRAKPGVSAQQAQDELSAIMAGLAGGEPVMRGWSANASPMRDVMSESLKPSLFALLGAAALVLLTGCANIANLLLARALARRNEVSVRMALGAGKARLAQQFLVESATLGLIGGAFGLAAGQWLLDSAARYLPQTLALRTGGGEVVLRPIEMSWPILAASLGISLLTAILFGLAPMWESLRTDLRSAMNESTRGSTTRTGWLRPVLLAFQIALALVLLAGASLLLRSFGELSKANLGFRRERLLTLNIELPTDSRYRDPQSVRNFYRETRRRILETPGVISAGYSNVLPLTPSQDHTQFQLEKGPAVAPGEGYAADFRSVTPGYFETLGIALRRGRGVSASDLNGKQRVVWIDETLEQRYFAGQDPVGQRILVGSAKTSYEIAGVVARAQQDALRRAEFPALYFAHDQAPTFRMALAVATRQDPLRLLPAVKQAIWSVDKDIPVYRVSTMDDLFRASTRNARLVLLLIGIFAAASLLLAAVGTYGVVAYQSQARAREFSIRLALGAQPAGIVLLTLRQTMWVALAGAAAGTAASLVALRPLESLLYNVEAADPLTLGAAAGVLLSVALLAALRPAIRATRADAVHTLGSQ